MFKTEANTPLDLHNVFARRIAPVLSACAECSETKKDHLDSEHEYARRSDVPEWHGWHAFRRGLATNLNDLGVLDLTIQRILRHSNVTTTRRAYFKPLDHQVTEGHGADGAGDSHGRNCAARTWEPDDGKGQLMQFAEAFFLIVTNKHQPVAPATAKYLKNMVSAAGLEPATHALKGHCSTN
jgi:hypothetical protein